MRRQIIGFGSRCIDMARHPEPELVRPVAPWRAPPVLSPVNLLPEAVEVDTFLEAGPAGGDAGSA